MTDPRPCDCGVAAGLRKGPHDLHCGTVRYDAPSTDPRFPIGHPGPRCMETVEIAPDVFDRCGNSAELERGGFNRCPPCDRAHVRALSLVSSDPRPMPARRIV